MPKATREAGKIGELQVTEMLIRLKFTVYTPVIDTGVDIIAERWNCKEEQRPTYYGLQVKRGHIQETNLWGWEVKRNTFRISKTNYLVLILDHRRLPPKLVSRLPKPEVPNLYALVVPTAIFDEFASKHSRNWRNGKSYAISVRPQDIDPEAGKKKTQFAKFAEFLNKWDQLLETPKSSARTNQ